MSPTARPRSRIQQRNRELILDAALEVFSQHGFRGATLDQIAEGAGLSKPNLLYYFPSKEEVHKALLTGLLDTWLDPLRAMDPKGDPLHEIMAYARRKLDLARDYPRESRLFANEILQGAPRMRDAIEGDLRRLVVEKAQVLTRWMDEGRIARVDPVHLIFSIWALTQHYADFDVQVRAVLGPGHDPFAEAGRFIETKICLRANQIGRRDNGYDHQHPGACSRRGVANTRRGRTAPTGRSGRGCSRCRPRPATGRAAGRDEVRHQRSPVDGGPDDRRDLRRRRCRGRARRLYQGQHRGRDQPAAGTVIGVIRTFVLAAQSAGHADAPPLPASGPGLA